MIPKIIHYCWFGKNPLPELARKCIESWRKFLPDYEIKEWNEDNFDINILSYVREAYDAKKYAFVSDFARFWILYNYGGVYFDTDVELIKPLEPIIEKGAYMGCEIDGTNQIWFDKNVSVTSGLGIACNPGLGIACNPGLEIYKEFIDGYKDRHFINNNGSFDLTTIVTYTTNILKKYGLKNEFIIQNIANINIYPIDYFCPIDFTTGKKTFTENTYSIHHYAASWHTPEEKYILFLKRKYHLLPEFIAIRLALLKTNIKYKGWNYTMNKYLKAFFYKYKLKKSS